MRFLFRLWIALTAVWAVIAYVLIGHPGPQGQPLPLGDLATIVLVPSLIVLVLGYLMVWAVAGLRAP